MNDKDLQFEILNVFYEMYLEVVREATHEQSAFADKVYYYLMDLRKECDFYKDHNVVKPENVIKEI